jgi:RNA polymerase sigma factor (sigma-70 family)
VQVQGEVQLLERPTHRTEGCVPAGSVTRARRMETGDIPEPELIRLAQQGDAAAFEALYQLHNRRVYSLCLRMVGNTAEAEDLTQEAFLQLFRKISTFRGESAFSTWLHRLAVNVVLMKLRKKSGKETSLEQVTDPDEESGTPRRDFGTLDVRLTTRNRNCTKHACGCGICSTRRFARRRGKNAGPPAVVRAARIEIHGHPNENDGLQRIREPA